MSSAPAPRYQEYALYDGGSDAANLPPAYDSSSAPHPDDLIDAKKSFGDDDNDGLDRVGSSPVSSDSVVFDCLKTKDFKYGTRIVSKTSLAGAGSIQADEVLYTIATHGAWNWRGAVVTFQRGDGKGPTRSSTQRYQAGGASGSAGPSAINGENPPYAELSLTKLRLAEAPERGEALEEQSRRKFLHSQKWWSA